MQALGGYVSDMAGNFFDTEYLRQKVVKAGMQVKKGGDSVLNENNDAEASKIPKFKIRQQNFVSQIEIDKNTMFYMARLKEAIGVGGNNADAIQRFDEFTNPFCSGMVGIFESIDLFHVYINVQGIISHPRLEKCRFDICLLRNQFFR